MIWHGRHIKQRVEQFYFWVYSLKCFLRDPLSNNWTAAEEQCFLRGKFWEGISRIISESWVSWVYSLSNEIIVRQLPSGKKLSTEAEDIVGIRHQATTHEDTADCEELVLAVVNCRLCELALMLQLRSVSVKYIQLRIQTPSAVTLIRVTIF
jgi:hypothetical protein